MRGTVEARHVQIVGVQVLSWSHGRADVPRDVRIDLDLDGAVTRTEWEIPAFRGQPNPTTTTTLQHHVYRQIRDELVREWHEAANGDLSWWMTR